MRFPRVLILVFVSVASVVSLRALDQRYTETLRELCDALVTTQITDRASPDFGALVCPSTNPQDHPLHSRAGESVYPLSIAYQITRNARYRDAAIHLADWMISKQQPSGAWGENAPKHDGWTGTTSDQLISLAGAWPVLSAHLTALQREVWQRSMRSAADFVVRSFPIGNINYQPTGAVALVLAAQAVESPRDTWLPKAESLMALTLGSINADGLIVGEGKGVDLGYNLAQSIGYIALYGILQRDETIRSRAAELLRVHARFVYPNGSVDNSWGTRSFKWTYESGTKTAPGVYFTFALLADLDPDFASTGLRCLDFLTQRTMTNGLVLYGPLSGRHDSTNPPCLYSTFTRAQSIAMAIVYSPPAQPVEDAHRAATDQMSFRYFPSVKVVVVRTPNMVATISADGEIGQYSRSLVSRGGSLTNLWIDGFGRDGFAQTSSVTDYKREEGAHMPIEGALRPLTSRAECTIDGVTFSNLFEIDGAMTATREGDHISVRTTGMLRSITGTASNVTYTIVHRFFGDRLTKEYIFASPTSHVVQIIEPFVQDAGTGFSQVSPTRVDIQSSAGRTWEFEITSGAADSSFFAVPNADQYWCPFPAVECHPIALEVKLEANAPVTTVLTLRAR